MALLAAAVAFNAKSAKAQTQGMTIDNPLDIPPTLSGNYGELRPNHFHAGIDLKTNGVEGLTVRSIADGFVSRIKVSPYGYGLALYIDHPNGTTSVYGHLRAYAPFIAEYVQQAQRAQQSFEVDIYPGASDLPIKRGQIIAESGNTGGSGGPHLHFEVRATHTEVPRNPLVMGFSLTDNISPVIEGIAWRPLKADGSPVHGTNAQHYTVRGGGIGRTLNITGPFGLEVKGYDQQNGAANHNGIYRITCYIDSQKVAEFVADSIAFDQSRYLNALIDYEHYQVHRSRYIRMYRLPGNALENVWYQNKGVIDLSEGAHTATIVAEDAAGNQRTVNIPIQYTPGVQPKAPKADLLPWNASYEFECPEAEVYLPKGTLYEDTPLDIRYSNELLYVLDYTIPAQERFSVRFNGPFTKEHFIAQVQKNGGFIRALGTHHGEGFMEAEAKYFGQFKVMKDDQKPRITLVRFAQNGTQHGDLMFGIKDNLSGIASFNAWIDGQWVVASYEPKLNRLTIAESELQKSPNWQEFKLEVVDGVGNVANFESRFKHL